MGGVGCCEERMAESTKNKSERSPHMPSSRASAPCTLTHAGHAVVRRAGAATAREEATWRRGGGVMARCCVGGMCYREVVAESERGV